MAVLLLNASFEPLHVIPLRRAMGLVVAGKVDVIANGDGEIHSATQTFPIPAVLRLRYMVRVPFRQNIALSRRAVLIRDQRRCQFSHCDRTASTIDHVVPRSLDQRRRRLRALQHAEGQPPAEGARVDPEAAAGRSAGHRRAALVGGRSHGARCVGRLATSARVGGGRRATGR